jgi:hypothetical protein
MRTPIQTLLALLLGGAGLFSVNVAVTAATLTNRYSFNESSGTTAIDSVSGQNGTFVNGSFSGTGQATISNSGLTSGNPAGQYLALPPNLLTNYAALTMEAWLTPTLDDITGGAFWARVWDFGNSDGTVGINGFIYSRIGNSTQPILADSFSAGRGDSWCFTSSTLLNGLENHFVWTADGTTHRARVYLNGVLVGTSDTFTNSPAIVGATTNDWLGRSQFSGDPYASASFNEFRIYSGTLNPLEVAANYQNGANTYPASYGSVTSIQLQVSSPLVAGAGTTAKVFASASGLTNSINIVDSDLAIAFSSGNTNIVKVDSLGNVSAVAAGSANVIATFGSVSSTQSVTVISVPTKLVHRYSFTADASDSIGTANGTLNGAATISGGQVVLDGITSYVSLPSNLIGTNLITGAFTIESWATFNPTSGPWGPLFAFGNSSGGNGFNYTFFTPNAANGPAARFAVGGSNVGEDQANQAGTFLGQTNRHIVCVFNPNPGRHFIGLYIDNQLVGSSTSLANNMATINDVDSWLGQSLFAADSLLLGSINEFRIYDGEVDKFQLAASFDAGPDATNLNIGSFVSFVVNTGGTIPKDDVRQVSALMNFTAATNINVSGDPTLTLTSSDTNVVTVNNAGFMTARNVGTATINASYQYIVGATTNVYSGSAPITVFRNNAAQLQHRYSFTSDASDSIGGANGTLMGNATVSGGNLVLDGTSGTYLNLPGGIVSSNTAVTIEAWATFGASSAWARLFDFGSTTGFGTNTTGPANFWWCGPNTGATTRSDVATTAGFNNVDGAPPLNNRTAHVTITYDPVDGMMLLYTNGVLIEANYSATVPLSSVSSDDAFIGRSQFPADPYLIASIDEFRIYNGALNSDEVAATEALGPSALLSTASPTLHVTSSGGNVVLTWPLASAGFTLQSRSSLSTGAWAPVPLGPQIVGANWQVIVPSSGSMQFYRLQH